PITEKQIRRRLEILKPYTQWIRTFSCTEGNELIPPLAKEYGIKTLVGAWLSDDKETNAEEIEGLINLAKQGYVDIAAVGNEVLYRKELTEAELLDYINKVKQQIPGTPVGYVDAYYEFTDRPQITEACDVILANCYPYWEGCHIDYSFLYMKEMYQQAVKAGNGKKVIITETGWPTAGGAFEASEASMPNFLKYFANAQQWAQNEDVELFYFSSFDESWKTGDEGDVGAYWGLWDKEEELKF
ncbi:MAG: glycoside hydrolase family 17 protein, partial [Methylophagaceae bacterium]